MPRVPVYDGPQVREAPLPGGYQDAGQLSTGARTLGQVGAGLSALGEATDRIVMRDAEAKANTADAEIDAGWRTWQAQNASVYRGERAAEFTPAAEKWWADAKTKYGAGLDPLAQGLIGKSLERRRLGSLAGVAQHVEVEQERHADAAAGAAIDQAAQRGVSTGDVAGAEADIGAKIGAIAARKKWDEKQTADAMFKALAGMRTAYTLKLAEENADAAAAYFAKIKEGIPLAQQQQVEKIVKAEGDNQFAQQKAASLAALPLEDQLVEAAKEKDPKRREKLLQNISANDGLKRQALAARENKFSDQAWQLVGKGQRVSEAVLSQMDGKERVQLQDYLRQRAEHAAKKGDATVKTDDATHRGLWAESVDNPEAFKDRRLDALGMKLSAADFEQLVNKQREMRNPKNEHDAVKFSNKMKSKLEILGIATKESDAQKRGAYTSAAYTLLEDYKRRTGKAPTPEEEDKLLDSLLLPGKAPWFSGNATTYAESIALKKPFVPDIAGEDRKALMERFKARGVAQPTEEQITTAYRAWKGLR